MISHALEAALLQGVSGVVRGTPWPASLRLGTRLGDTTRALGIRRRVAEDNLSRVSPGWSPEERQQILIEHYRELGRIAVEYPRLGELARAPDGDVVAEVRGFEHVEAAARVGRGVIFMTGHFGNFELLGAVLARRHPMDYVVRPMSNPHVDRWVAERRATAGIGTLRADRQVRGVYEALRAQRWVAMVADQDARRTGVFVPFMGRPASTASGPARVSLATGAPIVTGYTRREPDGRHVLELEPALEPPGGDGDAAVLALTAQHTARLEAWVRRYPWNWFWLHRRWKTAPPAE